MFDIFFKFIKNSNTRFNFIFPFLFLLLNITAFADNKDSGEKNNKNSIKWEKWEPKSRNFESQIKWEKYRKTSEEKIHDLEFNTKKNITDKNDLILNKKGIYNSINSFNRSIVINKKEVGPDISFLVPIGFKSSNKMKLDLSIRGWNRRPSNSNLFAWNNGDAVGQVFYNLMNTEKSSIGLNLGLRSLYSGTGLSGGSSSFGEGVSMGFRIDRELSDSSGIALGAEQLIHFDNKTDTGRDIYITYSKAYWNKKDENIFPFTILTGGIGTGYLALWEDTQFACSDLFGGAAVHLNKYQKLCWGPFSAVSFVFNNKFSSFIEYNNYSLMLGSSIAPTNKVRFTVGLTLAESYDDYKFKNSDELRWFSRVSLGF